jgi:hypothetical protein
MIKIYEERGIKQLQRFEHFPFIPPPLYRTRFELHPTGGAEDKNPSF